MTLIASVATDNFALMVGDMRRTNMLTGVYYDDTPKIYQVNDRVIVGHSGAPVMAESIIKALIPCLPEDGRIESVIAMFNAYRVDLRRMVRPNQMDVSFQVAGLNKANKMSLGYLSFGDNREDMIREVEDGDYIYQVSIADYNPVDWLDQELKGNKGNMNPDSIRRIAKKLVKHVAARDKYVSPEYTTLSVKRWGGESPPPQG